MGSARTSGDSDWDDQDLLSHEEAAERLRAEVAEIRARIIAWRNAEAVKSFQYWCSSSLGSEKSILPYASAPDGEMHARIRDEESRLLLIDERLVEIERTLRARGRSDPR